MKNRIIYSTVKYLLGVVVVFMFNSTLFAQEQPASKEDRVTKELGMMKTDLTLTADQEAKVKTVLTNYSEKEKQLREAAKEDREANKTKRADLQKQKDAELKTILSDEQYQKLQEKRKEHAGSNGHNGGNGGNGNGGHHKGDKGDH